ncbi:MAG TPA: class I SAM-dependent methyltransferase [Polyangiaceae bacterium]|nr:class I SAM-dependent methyltransferase [Polyangiaceae bacterium]
MSRKRRNVRVDDPSRWIFNRMADVYDARPAYPAPLIDTVVELAAPLGRRVLDLGAGIGHLALPLAERGLDVVAIEPAQAMLERLRERVRTSGIGLRAIHATAEQLPFDGPNFDLAIIADAMHFLDAELVAAELRRVLVPRGVLAIVSCEPTMTPFMQSVWELIHATSDRRTRNVEQAILRLAVRANVRLSISRRFQDETEVDLPTLERILRSVSFVGPAFGAERMATLCAGLRDISHAPAWARTFTLRAGHKRRDTTYTSPPVSGHTNGHDSC